MFTGAKAFEDHNLCWLVSSKKRMKRAINEVEITGVLQITFHQQKQRGKCGQTMKLTGGLTTEVK